MISPLFRNDLFAVHALWASKKLMFNQLERKHVFFCDFADLGHPVVPQKIFQGVQVHLELGQVLTRRLE